MKGFNSVCEIVIGALVIIFALWDVMYAKWILVALGIILIVHSFTCKMCCGNCDMPAEKQPRRRK